MKTKLKNRIVSGLLAFAMMLSLLPAGLIPEAEAASIDQSQCSLTIDSEGNFTAIFKGTFSGGLGLHYFVLVPDIKGEGGANTIGEAMSDTGEISSATQTLDQFKSKMLSEANIAWNDEVCYALDNQVVDNGTSIVIKTDSLTIKGKIPNPDRLKDIYGYSTEDSGIPYVVFLRSEQGGSSTAGYAKGSYTLSGLRVTPIDSVGRYDVADTSVWEVNGTDHGKDWLYLNPSNGAVAARQVFVLLENLGSADKPVSITGITLKSADPTQFKQGTTLRDVSTLYGKNATTMALLDTVVAAPSTPGYYNFGTETAPKPKDIPTSMYLRLNMTNLAKFQYVGKLTFEIRWSNSEGIPQTPKVITVELTTAKLAWEYPENTDQTVGPAVINASADYGYQVADVTGRTTQLRWTGGDATITSLPTTINMGGSVPSGSTLTYVRTRGNKTLVVGDDLQDGDIITVTFNPVRGFPIKTSHTGSVVVIAANTIRATVNVNFAVKALTADTTVTVYKDGQAWNNPDNGITSIELDDGASTYAGTWTNNVWKATGTLNDGTYDVMVNNTKVGSMEVTYGQSKNFDLNYYTVTVKKIGRAHV